MLKHYKRIPIGKLKNKPGWCVVSHRTGKVLSCYKTKKKGREALKRIARFSKRKSK